jgi:NADPH-dependent curcumin reductase CurA
MVQNKAFFYKKVPNGWPVAGQDLTIEDVGFDETAGPPKNGITTKNLYATFDPSQRGRMRDPSVSSYSPAMDTGKPVVSVSVIGKVLKSANSNYSEGTLVLLWLSATETYSVVPEHALKMAEIINPKPGVPLTAYLGLLGMTGKVIESLLDAVFSFTDFGEA